MYAHCNGYVQVLNPGSNYQIIHTEKPQQRSSQVLCALKCIWERAVYRWEKDLIACEIKRLATPLNMMIEFSSGDLEISLMRIWTETKNAFWAEVFSYLNHFPEVEQIPFGQKDLFVTREFLLEIKKTGFYPNEEVLIENCRGFSLLCQIFHKKPFEFSLVVIQEAENLFEKYGKCFSFIQDAKQALFRKFKLTDGSLYVKISQIIKISKNSGYFKALCEWSSKAINKHNFFHFGSIRGFLGYIDCYHPEMKNPINHSNYDDVYDFALSLHDDSVIDKCKSFVERVDIHELSWDQVAFYHKQSNFLGLQDKQRCFEEAISVTLRDYFTIDSGRFEKICAILDAHSIRCLDLKNGALKERHLKILSNFSNLEKLALTSEFSEEIFKLKNLRWLYWDVLYPENPLDLLFKLAHSFPNLTFLNIGHDFVDISERDLEKLPEEMTVVLEDRYNYPPKLWVNGDIFSMTENKFEFCYHGFTRK